MLAPFYLQCLQKENVAYSYKAQLIIMNYVSIERGIRSALARKQKMGLECIQSSEITVRAAITSGKISFVG